MAKPVPDLIAEDAFISRLALSAFPAQTRRYDESLTRSLMQIQADFFPTPILPKARPLTTTLAREITKIEQKS
jgi:hypothetical protein